MDGAASASPKKWPPRPFGVAARMSKPRLDRNPAGAGLAQRHGIGAVVGHLGQDFPGLVQNVVGIGGELELSVRSQIAQTDIADAVTVRLLHRIILHHRIVVDVAAIGPVRIQGDRAIVFQGNGVNDVNCSGEFWRAIELVATRIDQCGALKSQKVLVSRLDEADAGRDMEVLYGEASTSNSSPSSQPPAAF